MNESPIEQYNKFTNEHNALKENLKELNGLWKKNLTKDFEKWFDGVNQIAFKNLSQKNGEMTQRNELSEGWDRSRVFVATKTGIRHRYYHSVQTDALSIEAIAFMITKRDEIALWIETNKSKEKADVFRGMCDSIKKKYKGFDISSMKKKDSDSYHNFNPQQLVDGFAVQENISVLSIYRGKVEKAVMKEIVFKKHSWNDFEISLSLVFSDGTTGAVSFDEEGKMDRWTWFLMQDCFPAIKNFLGDVSGKMKEAQEGYDGWVAQIKNDLMVYSSLMAL